MKRVFECSRCEDERWVCENHADKAWAGNLEFKHDPDKVCECGAGCPCRACNDPLTWDAFDKPGCEIIATVYYN